MLSSDALLQQGRAFLDTSAKFSVAASLLRSAFPCSLLLSSQSVFFSVLVYKLWGAFIPSITGIGCANDALHKGQKHI